VQHLPSTHTQQMHSVWCVCFQRLKRCNGVPRFVPAAVAAGQQGHCSRCRAH
jgi:hypothetical protein